MHLREKAPTDIFVVKSGFHKKTNKLKDPSGAKLFLRYTWELLDTSVKCWVPVPIAQDHRLEPVTVKEVRSFSM